MVVVLTSQAYNWYVEKSKRSHDDVERSFYDAIMIMRFETIVSVLLLSIVLALSGCTNHGPLESNSVVSPQQPTVQLPLPATFTGAIPCDDCEYVEIALTLRPDFLYQLRKTYHNVDEAPRIEAQMERWRYSSGGSLIVLGKERGRLKTYRIMSKNRLRFVNWEGALPEDQIRYDLTIADLVDPFPDVVRARGMFFFDGESASITECAGEQKFAVARDGAYDELVQRYLNTPLSQGQPLLISFFGSLRPSFDGLSGSGEEIVVDRLRRVYPNLDCQGNQLEANLTGTFWRLVELNDQPVEAPEGRARAFLSMAADRTLTGYGGCNRFSGTYLVKGDVFLINRHQASRIVCNGAMAAENDFLTALDETETYRLDQSTLDLLDQNDRRRARFTVDTSMLQEEAQ
ncbi:MAG: META domain-containing protein [Desulfofustis sp. PB-SRB1]|nr:META domain-containing protein [Desulfofustis sp. PB-SRB1]